MPFQHKDGFQVVGETMCCEHFEPVPGRLFCMKECWYCKWSEFVDDSGSGICRYAGDPDNAENPDDAGCPESAVFPESTGYHESAGYPESAGEDEPYQGGRMSFACR